MKLSSHVSGARRHLCREHRPLTYRGRANDGEMAFECLGDDGGTLTLNAFDLPALLDAGLVMSVKAVLADGGAGDVADGSPVVREVTLRTASRLVDAAVVVGGESRRRRMRDEGRLL